MKKDVKEYIRQSKKLDGETFTFIPTSRLGRFIIYLAMDMRMYKERNKHKKTKSN